MVQKNGNTVFLCSEDTFIQADEVTMPRTESSQTADSDTTHDNHQLAFREDYTADPIQS